MKALLQCDIQRVWEVVTSLEDYSWRSDLSKIEIINENQFIEYTKDGYSTTFTITVKEPYTRLEFDMENENIKGHWIGLFTQRDGQTEINFMEDITAKKIILKTIYEIISKKATSIICFRFKKSIILMDFCFLTCHDMYK